MRFFIYKEGKVKLTVVSEIGKEATIGILNTGDFFGEGCLTGQPLRLNTRTRNTGIHKGARRRGGQKRFLAPSSSEPVEINRYVTY
jgi:CRP-like cAMP-binding protein